MRSTVMIVIIEIGKEMLAAIVTQVIKTVMIK